MKRKRVLIKTRSFPDSLSLKGQVIKDTTVKLTIWLNIRYRHPRNPNVRKITGIDVKYKRMDTIDILN